MTEEQRAAVRAPPDQHVTIVAGPGTGKTYTLVRRIEHLTRSCGMRNVVALSFTVAAARELDDRLTGLVPPGSSVRCTTLHAWALDLLDQLPELAGRTVYDADDAQDIRGLVARTTPPKMIPEVYRQRLREAHATDYDLLITDLLDWLPTLPAHHLPTHLMVDEYQDLDETQHRIVDLLVDRGVIVTTVGDPRQSIYQWRGARPDLMRQYGAVVHLTTSFRSTPEIVASANRHYPHLPELRAVHDAGAPVVQISEAHADDVHRFEVQTRGQTRAILCRTWRDCGDAYDVLGPDRACWYGPGPRTSPNEKALARWIRLAVNPSDTLLMALLIQHLHGDARLQEAIVDGIREAARDLLPPIPTSTVTAEVAEAYPEPVPADRLERLRRPFLRSTPAFARWWSLGRDTRPTMDPTETRVHVMSVHSAKGLEWDAVLSVTPPPHDEESRSLRYVAETRPGRLLWASDRARIRRASP